MKFQKMFFTLLTLMLCLFAGCSEANEPALPEQPSTSSKIHDNLVETILPETEAPSTEAVTKPLHSELYIPGVSVEDVVAYFHEVCLDSEFINSGDPSFVQKWADPIYYTLYGEYTDEDLAVLSSFANWLNTIPGFPGIYEVQASDFSNLRIHFCSESHMVDLMGDNFWGTDGGVTFWYNEEDVIYDAIICYRTDLDQYLRNSVILEEIYNGLGPIQDTSLRPDSIIYQEFSQMQALSPVDKLILQLLYHPDILPGMNAQQCEQVIRSLYY